MEVPNAVGMVCRASQGESVLGTCTAFQRPDVALTAAHCVEGVDANDLHVFFFSRGGQMRTVEEITRHDTADLCVLRLYPGHEDDLGGTPDNAFWQILPRIAMGQEFMTFGYPVARTPQGPLLALQAARVVRGHIQRFLEFGEPDGYRFQAAELSEAAPTGMSGGPLFSPQQRAGLIGIVAGSTESSVEAFKRYELRDGVETYIEKVDRITTYGIGLMLDPLRDWLTPVLQQQATNQDGLRRRLGW